jgi:molybdate transport system ATP-binding protein
MLTVDVKKRLRADRKDDFVLNVSFTVGNGFTVIAGPSGAGKTTTLRLIAGILAADEGTIKLGDTVFFDSRTRTDLAIQARRVGFVFQEYALFPHLTAEENIAYGIKSAAKRERSERALELLELFRIEHLSNRMPREMSGGEQQRVALARALASDPAIVLLDEPLSAVDAKTRAELLDEIENMQQKFAVPFIYVTHNDAEAERLGKHRILLNGGSVVERTGSA